MESNSEDDKNKNKSKNKEAPCSSLPSTALKYYEMFGKERDFPQYLVNPPRSQFAISASNIEKARNVVSKTSEYLRGDQTSKTSVNKWNIPTITGHDGKPLDILNEDTGENVRLSSPTSSVASNKRLEWDSGADVGYLNYRGEKERTKSLPVLSTIDQIIADQNSEGAINKKVPKDLLEEKQIHSDGEQARICTKASVKFNNPNILRLKKEHYSLGIPDAESTPLSQARQRSAPHSGDNITPILKSENRKTESENIHIDIPVNTECETKISLKNKTKEIKTKTQINSQNSTLSKDSTGSSENLYILPTLTVGKLRKYHSVSDVRRNHHVKLSTFKKSRPKSAKYKHKEGPNKPIDKNIQTSYKGSEMVSKGVQVTDSDKSTNSSHSNYERDLKEDLVEDPLEGTSRMYQNQSPDHIAIGTLNLPKSNSFEYLPGNTYEQRSNSEELRLSETPDSEIKIEKPLSDPLENLHRRSYQNNIQRPSKIAATNKSSFSSSQTSTRSHTEASSYAGSSNSVEKDVSCRQLSNNLIKDLEKTVDMIKNLVNSKQCMKHEKKKIIKQVVQKLVDADYDDDSNFENDEREKYQNNETEDEIMHEIYHRLNLREDSNGKLYKVSKNGFTSVEGTFVKKSPKKDNSERSKSKKNQENIDRNVEKRIKRGQKLRDLLNKKYEDVKSSNQSDSSPLSQKSKSPIKKTCTKSTSKKDISHNVISSGSNNEVLQIHANSTDFTNTSSSKSDYNIIDIQKQDKYTQRKYIQKYLEDKLERRQIQNLLLKSKLKSQMKISEKTDDDKDLMSFAEKERKNQLAWIQTEIEHLNNLKKLLENKSQDENSSSVKAICVKNKSDKVNSDWSSHNRESSFDSQKNYPRSSRLQEVIRKGNELYSGSTTYRSQENKLIPDKKPNDTKQSTDPYLKNITNVNRESIITKCVEPKQRSESKSISVDDKLSKYNDAATNTSNININNVVKEATISTEQTDCCVNVNRLQQQKYATIPFRKENASYQGFSLKTNMNPELLSGMLDVKMMVNQRISDLTATSKANTYDTVAKETLQKNTSDNSDELYISLSNNKNTHSNITSHYSSAVKSNDQVLIENNVPQEKPTDYEEDKICKCCLMKSARMKVFDSIKRCLYCQRLENEHQNSAPPTFYNKCSCCLEKMRQFQNTPQCNCYLYGSNNENQSEEDIQLKNPQAYFLTIESTEDLRCVDDEPVRKVSLEEVKIYVPKRKKIVRSSVHSAQFDFIYKDVRDEERNDSAETENKRLTVQEYLLKNRPGFVDHADTRRKCIAELALLRQLREEKRRVLISLSGGMDNFNTDVDEQYKSKKHRLFSSKAMVEMTKKKYNKLPEVQSKVHRNKWEQQLRTNRLMAQVYNKKLQRNVHQGRITLSHSVSVISNL